MKSMHALLQQDPGNASLRSQCIQLALSAGNLQQAESLLRDAAEGAQRDPQLRYASACIAMTNKDFASAGAQLESLLADGVDNAGVRISLATCMYMSNQHARVVALLQPIESTLTSQPSAVRLLVSSLHHLGEVDQAVEVAGRHPTAAEGDGPTAGVFALLYLDADDAANAGRWADLALQRNPNSIDGLITRGTLDLAEQNADKAEPHFQRVLQAAPDNARAWIGLGSISLMQQNFDEAKQRFEKGLEQLPQHLGTWLVLGWNHLLAGDLPAAERTFQHALELDHNFGETHGALAAVAALQGRHADAERLCTTALRLDPDSQGAVFAQAVMMGAKGDPQGAQRKIMRAAGKMGIQTRRSTHWGES
jgi:tetratricopeptide (TPR) repeat protein